FLVWAVSSTSPPATSGDTQWAVRRLLEALAGKKPLLVVLEDVHWAEPTLLDLVEHLADFVRAPLLIVCLARPELLEARPGWGGGRVRSTAIELEPLSEEESELLVEKLLAQLAGTSGAMPGPLPREVLERTEGNPLFVEETIRMLVESGSGNGATDRVPDTLQALIAARIDHLSPAAKTLLQRASVVGRVFWSGALEYLSPDVRSIDSQLDDLLQREFLLREPRSSISGETAYRFKHLLIREVAYTGLPKLARAQHHARFAEWLAERTGEELVEIRAYHLDQAVEFLVELEGAAPEQLAQQTGAALVKAAKRAIAREAYATARTLGLRALELRPTLSARYTAARAAWRLQDWAAVQVEMEKVRDEAREQDDRVVTALALTALGEASIKREGDITQARALVDEALEILANQEDPAAHFDVLVARASVASWQGSESDAVRFMERAYVIALDAGRKDLQTIAAQALARTHIMRLELEEAELLLTRALGLAGESGSVRGRVSATSTYGWFLSAKGELDEAESVFEEVRTTATELGVEPAITSALLHLGWIARRKGEHKRAEKLLREALRITAARGDRGLLPDFQSALAATLADLCKVDEAERLALDARRNASPEDTSCKIIAATALAAVRGVQGRDSEAEGLFHTALELTREGGFEVFEIEPLERLTRFLRDRGRADEAAPYEARLAELSSATRTARIA
ncbi:MAG TPA: tetratricopeptide repeat protein, partial [Gaiellaceae bacterium]|nr:tetratricopeptide repeat protein [Gaiellaceae bacterium]